MRNVHLTIAMSDYEHVRDFLKGDIKAEGIDLTHLDLIHEEIFYRFLNFREWDVSEISFAKYVSLVSQNDQSLKAIPVFPSRVFRLSSLYVHRDGPVKKPEDLRGKKIGIPEWAQTASVYTRGYLQHHIGIPLSDIEWLQAGVNEPGRKEKVALKIPEGIRYRSIPDRCLNEMLLSKEIDAAMTARPPESFIDGHPDVVRLFPDFQAAEEKYWRETGIIPIMHTIVIRAQILERYPWVAMNLLKAFESAKQRSIARIFDVASSRIPIPWGFEYAARAKALFGDEYWPYGIDSNRTVLEAFLLYAYEQGVCHRHLKPEELFPVEVQSSVKI